MSVRPVFFLETAQILTSKVLELLMSVVIVLRPLKLKNLS